MKNCFDLFFMKPILGMISKKGAIETTKVPNPFTLHSFSRGNVSLRRSAGYYRPSRSPIRSRYMGGY